MGYRRFRSTGSKSHASASRQRLRFSLTSQRRDVLRARLGLALRYLTRARVLAITPIPLTRPPPLLYPCSSARALASK